MGQNLIFNYHPLLMVLGTVFAATEGILAYRTLGMSKAITKVAQREGGAQARGERGGAAC